MEQTTVSSKYQVVIPKAVRERIDLQPGQKLAVLLKGDVISLVPIRPLQELRGIAEGADISDLREKEDRV
ncbi:MAG: AbrB/MazE/SpoVT family DNA-binding domain-containing protein [Armatimonadota bacterium]